MRKRSGSMDTYKVGYGRPPQHTRFRPGQSGNPNGRPKQPHTLTSLVGKLLKEKMSIVENGKEKRVPRLEALARSMIAKAIKGESKALSSLLNLLSQSPQLQEQRHVIEWEFVEPISREGSKKEGKNST
jgi:uncharacterized protein DUF5681